eukprot:1488903-Prymnesium_polylepis.3
MRKSGVNTASKILTVTNQERFQGTTQASPAVRVVPRPSDGGSCRGMVSTDHMQKARVRNFHAVAYGGQTDSAVSGSAVLNPEFGGHFPLASNSTR